MRHNQKAKEQQSSHVTAGLDSSRLTFPKLVGLGTLWITLAQQADAQVAAPPVSPMLPGRSTVSERDGAHPQVPRLARSSAEARLEFVLVALRDWWETDGLVSKTTKNPPRVRASGDRLKDAELISEFSKAYSSLEAHRGQTDTVLALNTLALQWRQDPPAALAAFAADVKLRIPDEVAPLSPRQSELRERLPRQILAELLEEIYSYLEMQGRPIRPTESPLSNADMLDRVLKVRSVLTETRENNPAFHSRLNSVLNRLSVEWKGDIGPYLALVRYDMERPTNAEFQAAGKRFADTQAKRKALVEQKMAAFSEAKPMMEKHLKAIRKYISDYGNGTAPKLSMSDADDTLMSIKQLSAALKNLKPDSRMLAQISMLTDGLGAEWEADPKLALANFDRKLAELRKEKGEPFGISPIDAEVELVGRIGARIELHLKNINSHLQSSGSRPVDIQLTDLRSYHSSIDSFIYAFSHFLNQQEKRFGKTREKDVAWCEALKVLRTEWKKDPTEALNRYEETVDKLSLRPGSSPINPPSPPKRRK